MKGKREGRKGGRETRKKERNLWVEQNSKVFSVLQSEDPTSSLDKVSISNRGHWILEGVRRVKRGILEVSDRRAIQAS